MHPDDAYTSFTSVIRSWDWHRSRENRLGMAEVPRCLVLNQPENTRKLVCAGDHLVMSNPAIEICSGSGTWSLKMKRPLNTHQLSEGTLFGCQVIALAVFSDPDRLCDRVML